MVLNGFAELNDRKDGTMQWMVLWGTFINKGNFTARGAGNNERFPEIFNESKNDRCKDTFWEMIEITGKSFVQKKVPHEIKGCYMDVGEGRTEKVCLQTARNLKLDND